MSPTRSKAATRRRAAGSTRSRPAKEKAFITLRVGEGRDGIVARLPASEKLIGLSASWMYILRNRSRWSGNEDLRSAMERRAKDNLKDLGVSEEVLINIKAGRARRIEIEFHEQNVKNAPGAAKTALLDAASTFPWEFILSAATREVGRTHPLLITRFIASARQRTARPGPLLFVESAPGRIGKCYSFDSERSRLEAAVTPQRAGGRRTWIRARSPLPEFLGGVVKKYKPRVIHVTGVDNHQVAQLPGLGGFYDEEKVRKHLRGALLPDGLIMRGRLYGVDAPEIPVPFNELARALVDPGGEGNVPMLVTLNFSYSAARTARECIRRGAQAAIGFLDEVPDDTAEYFFQTFYSQWGGQGSFDGIQDAFSDTWSRMRERGQTLYGTGIVLWLSRSAFTRDSGSVDPAEEFEESEPKRPQLPTRVERAATRKRPMTEILQVDLKVPREVNYSLLHNSRSLLDTLTLTKLVNHPLDEVSVEVELSAGSGSSAFRHTEVLLTEPQLALANEVKIPLTASLLRTSRERVQSTLYVKVAWDGRIACQETESVTLLPVDEWFDDTANNPWLPSFVLPRDPAIARIITAARRHLVTLQDDPSAGFDGYQSTDVPNDDCESVDQQVQSLWTTLLQDYRLAYINPPPAYSKRNQRLRTPSEIVGSKSGTCIDLSLLLASCLEYVDIYSVLVLLSGHCFIGYWRSEEYHGEFCKMSNLPKSLGLEVGSLSRTSTVHLVDEYGWRLAQQQYDEIHEYLRGDKIRFVEATGLCFNYSFADALDEGKADMKSAVDFDSLLDITLARRAEPPVTPLPVIRREERDEEGR